MNVKPGDLAIVVKSAAGHERRAFEAWFGLNAAEGCWAARDIWDTEQYQSPYTQTAWLAWQAARTQTLEDMCARIKAADDSEADRDYMLDSNDCIAVILGTWRGPMANDCPPKPSEAA